MSPVFVGLAAWLWVRRVMPGKLYPYGPFATVLAVLMAARRLKALQIILQFPQLAEEGRLDEPEEGRLDEPEE